ncbi:uncharacterized protein LOC132615555 isoform X2 [Lycium barbarum]|uniref:uncharacterized protein LOC132615555 isoform X2 n=1 Tax=Lycium barbarum TaxID=112863 RepID=UPI00293E6A4F|nr:uncharacterized protein LOC132615555 isoform X2 [Lycium barbarum]
MTTPLSLSVSSTKKRSSDKEDELAMEKEKQEEEASQREHQPPYISRMRPLTKEEAYGGGMYGKDDETPATKVDKAPASETQSADGPKEAASIQPENKPPQSSGHRDIDITGQSYIQ